MRIAVCSDSHDHILNLRRAVRRANQEGAELLHCGELLGKDAPPSFALFDASGSRVRQSMVDERLLTDD